jgi:hypothetical protein
MPQGGGAADCASGARGRAWTVPHRSLGRRLIELGAELGRLSDGGDGSGWSGRGCSARDSAANVVGVGAQRATHQRAGELEDEGVKGVVSAWTAISESAKRVGSSGYLMGTLRLLHRRLKG